MDLIEKYISAVSGGLPVYRRKAAVKDLRSAISSMLSDRCGECAPGENDVEFVLLKLGDPAAYAAKYRHERSSLIGPDSYDSYIYLLIVIMSSVLFAITVGEMFKFSLLPPDNFPDLLRDILGPVSSGLFQSFAWITVIYALCDRIRKPKAREACGEKWKISCLSEYPDRDGIVKPSVSAYGIILSIILLVYFAYANPFIGYRISEGSDTTVVIPLFSVEGINIYLPLITLFFIVLIFKECLKQIIGRWNIFLGLSVVALNAAAFIISLTVFIPSSVWNPNFVSRFLTTTKLPVPSSITTVSMMRSMPKYFVCLIAVYLFIESLIAMVKAIKYKSKP